MKTKKNKQISGDVSVFHRRPLPDQVAYVAGYAALIDFYDLQVPLPEKIAAISSQHKQYATEGWSIYTLRHKPEDTLQGHLTFALKYEGVDLAVLHALFSKIHAEEIETWVKSEPVGRYSRRIWFFYEWLMEKTLNLRDVETGNFVNAIDSTQQYPGPSKISKRHRIRNNLPGVRDFCPLVKRTEKLESFIAMHLDQLAQKKMGKIHPDVLARAAAFLLLKDSRASFAIEGERPGKHRAERWGRAISQAGLYPLSLKEFIRLQKIVIEDQRFVPMGLRKEGGFIGVHERLTGTPLPDHISAKWQDLPRLLDGLISTYQRFKGDKFDSVVLAAIISFGFVFIHPFADGNGRIQRYLIHHVLAEHEFTPMGVVFPISAVILERIDEYRRILESYSRPRLEFIKWRATKSGNVEVLNDTIDLYRYFDATLLAEFLYDCVRQTVEKTLPNEISYLEQYDQMKTAINERFDMPDHTVDLLIRFLQQNKGVLSQRAKEKEFKALTTKECDQLEKLYRQIFLDPT
ncbi:MAG TPA: Fic family protein [Alphaproteobacteria bacterium]|nr:Fic family protein [Alphaproteobacteria bacterium]